VLYTSTALIWDTERLFFVSLSMWKREPRLGKKKQLFKNLLLAYGYSEQVARELWKWYDFSEKKGVASF
jgi:hypothetical protein